MLACSGAGATEIRVLVDADNNPNSGCTVMTVDGPFAGIEHTIIASVDDAGDTVVSVVRRACVDPGAGTFGAAVPVTSTATPPWPVGVGAGVSGADVIEFDATLAELTVSRALRVGFETENAGGETDALLSVNGSASGPPIRVVLQIPSIPTGSEVGLIAFGVAVLVCGLWVLRRRPGAAGFVVVFLIAAAGAAAAGFIVLDGDPADWAGAADASAVDPIGDSVVSTDIHGGWVAVTPDFSVVAFRLDMTRNQEATAADDGAMVDEDSGATIIDVLANDNDPDGDPFVILSATQPLNGMVVVSSGGADLSYQPDPEYCNDGVPTDDFSYTITGGDSATVAIAVTCVDDPAVASDDIATVTEDDPATAIDVLANDSDVEGDAFQITGVTQPPGGAVVVTGGGTGLTYQPNSDFCNDGVPTDDFAYTITGGDTGTVSVTVTCVDDPAVAIDDAATVTEDDPATAIDVLANDSDVEGDAFQITGVTQPPGGAVIVTGGGTGLTYQPNPDFCNDAAPTDDFSYTITGGDTGTVLVTVTCVDDPAVANDDAATVTEDDPATAIDVLANDSDVEGDVFQITGVTQPPGGAVVVTGGGTGLTYQPNADLCNDGVPTDDFAYTITGGDTGTVSVTVTCVDDPAVATDDAATVTEDDPATAIDVLANDSDVEGDVFQVTGVTQPAGGVVIITGGGTGLTYQPNPDFCNDGVPTDDFVYTITGGDTGTVSVTVSCVDDPAVAVDDAAMVTEDDPATAIDVLANDSDADGDSFTVAGVSQPSGGVVVITGGGTGLTYQPNPNFCNDGAPTDDFTYTITGGSVGSVAVTVVCVNDPPTAGADAYVTVGNTELTAGGATPTSLGRVIDPAGVLLNDSDPVDGTPVFVAGIGGDVTPPFTATTTLGGDVQMAADGSFVYVPPVGIRDQMAGSADSFQYTLEDAGGAQVLGTVTIEIEDALVWWVHNDPAGEPLNDVGGDGRSNDPFDILGDGGADVIADDPEDAGGEGDVIFVFAGDGTSTGHNSGIELKSGQQLLGHRAATLVLAGVTIQTPAGGARPVVGNASGDGVSVVASNVNGSRSGVAVRGLSVVASGVGVNVVATDTESLDIALSDVSFASITDAALVVNGSASSGAAVVTELGSVESIAAVNSGMRFTDVVFDSDLTTPGVQPVSAGDLTVGDPLSPTDVTGDGLRLHGVRGSLELANLTVGNSGGTGLWIRDADGKAGTFAFATLDGRIVTNGAAAVDIDPVALSVALSELSSASSVNSGIVLDTVTGSFAVSGTTTVSSAGGTAIRVANSPGATLDFGQTVIDGPSAAGIDVATNNAGALVTFDTLNVTTNSGFGLVAANSGTVNINSVAAVISATGGPAVDLSGTAGQTNGLSGWTFQTLSSTNSSGYGIRLSDVPSTFDAGGGTIAGSTAQGVLVTGGSQNVTIGASVANPSGRPVEVTGRAGGSVQFSGAVSSTGSPGILVSANSSGNPSVSFVGAVDLTNTTGRAVDVVSNTGGTISFADLDIVNTTSNQPGVLASGSGLVSVVTGTVSTGSGRAVEASNSGLGIVLRSVTTNGAPSAISLTNTTGTFEVAGNGPTNPADTTRGRIVALAGTGGSVQNSTGAQVVLNNAAGVTLRNMEITNTTGLNNGFDGIDAVSVAGLTLDNMLISDHPGNHGIDGTSVTGLAILHSEIHSNATASGVEGPDVWNIRFDNLGGVSSVTHSVCRNARENVFGVVNSTGTLDLTVTNSGISDTAVIAPGNVGLLVDLTGDARADVDVVDSEFRDNRTRGVQFLSNSGTSRGSLDVSGSTFEDNFVGIDLAHQSAGQDVTFDIVGNTLNQNAIAGESNAINVVLGGTSAVGTRMIGTVSSNVIGNPAITDSGSAQGAGILLHAQGAGTITALAEGNRVRGIRIDNAFATLNNNGSARLNLTLSGNDLSVLPTGNFPLGGLDLQAGAIGSDSGTTCVNFRTPPIPSNITFDGSGFGVGGIQAMILGGTSIIEIVGYAGAPNDVAALTTFLNGTASTVNPAPFVLPNTGTIRSATSTCPVP